MKVTVAIPLYNAEKFIKEAVESVLRQTTKVDELLIIDDCSTDKSYEIVKELAQQNEIIKIYKNKNNLGYAKNWNKCLHLASTNFVVLLHSDDLLKRDTIKKQLDFFKLHPSLAFVGGQEDYFKNINEINHFIVKKKSDKIFESGKIYEFVKCTNSYIPCSTVMFNMIKIKQVGFFQEDVLATDEIYWPKVLNLFSIAILGYSLVNRRIHADQAEYNDFKNKKEKIIGWAPHFRNILDYENRPKEKGLLTILIKKKIAYTMLNVAKNVIKYHRSFNLFVYYIYHSIEYNPKILFDKILWKSITKSILIYFKLLRG